MDNLGQQIEACLNELSDDELNKLALHLKMPRAHEGIQAQLGVKISDQQRTNFFKWIQGTGKYTENWNIFGNHKGNKVTKRRAL